MKSGIDMKRKRLISILLLSLIIISVYLFRFQLLFVVGDFLVKQDPLEKSDAMFVLSGRPFERGIAAMNIFFDGYADSVICMGSTIPQDISALGYNYTEAELIKHFLCHRMQIPENVVITLPEGSSTYEESEAILEYALEHKLKKIIIVSSSFHTRRIQQTFRNKFEDKGIQIIVRGHAAKHKAQNWWKEEHELINVNNEYIKLMYYKLKY